ncbi:hypothetical protein GIY23_11675 [Allosaccharopolyspora coralli]|uniref:DUF2157 domain-containing protein n=1 Tax=Allosaccharopolyspora coralli TaxID=2665642 RepID=A0A5Q3Q9S0_9PSEU|nr:hypothetical protein [Allosaccharopolyspora coralli]QGK70096.1 hypothetical protein GIY23_11675 [Allosaccharopolyspora coralli]
MTGELTPRQRAAVRGLVERGVLSPDQADVVLTELAAASVPSASGTANSPGQRRGGLWEVLGYAGAALVFGGAALLLHMSWEDLGQVARVSILLALAALVTAAGVLVAGGPSRVRSLRPASTPRRRIVAALFVLAAPLVAMAVSTGSQNEWAVPTATAGLVVAVVGYLALPSVPGMLAMGAFSVGVVYAATGDWWPGATMLTAALLVALGGVWIALSLAEWLAERTVGLTGGAFIALLGAQWALGLDSTAWGYGATLALAVVFFGLYVRWQDLPLLVAGIVGVTVSVPEAVWDLTGGALGGPLVVLLAGVALLGAGVFGLRLRKRTGPHGASGDA